MICSGIIKDKNTIELKISMPFEAGQRVSLVILPYREECADDADSQSPRLPTEEVNALELIVGQDKSMSTKQVQGSSPVDIARVMRALPNVPPEDVGALERAMMEGKNLQGDRENP